MMQIRLNFIPFSSFTAYFIQDHKTVVDKDKDFL